MTVSAEVQTPVEPKRPDPRAGARLLAAAGLLIAVLATVVTAVAELYLTPLRLGGVPIGVAVRVRGGGQLGSRLVRGDHHRPARGAGRAVGALDDHHAVRGRRAHHARAITCSAATTGSPW